MASPDTQADDRDPAPDPLAESGRYVVHAELPLDEIFTRREARLVARLRGFCTSASTAVAEDVRGALRVGFRSMGALATALSSYPSLYEAGTLGGKERTEATLMRTLLAAGEHGLEWSLPTKAVLSRTFGIAKVNFWVSLRYALHACDTEETKSLFADVQEAIEEAVYTRLAEELYASFVTSRVMAPQVKRLAIEQLMEIWEGRASFTTHRFCPILRSAWVARCRAPRVFGTMMGASEIVSLLFQDCDERFVESFTAADPGAERLQAFEEFVFDLPFEDLEKVRSMMAEEDRDVVGPDEVARYLGYPKGKLNPLIEDPKALYSSFRTRRVKAQYRTSMRIPGPKRTAESYVLEGLLLSGHDDPAE
jgi:hypothetical protein